jgi:formate-dependent nitrite reductase membrane component NrfD
MSIGAWALLLFSIVSTISFLGAAWDVGVLKLRPCSVPSRLHGTWLGRTFDFVGAIAGFFIASYTGALLSATNQPIWSDSKWIAALFLVSSAATGIAAVQVASRLTGMGDSASHEKLSRLDTGVLALELILIAMFVSSLPVPWPDLLGQWPIVLLLTGALGVGVLIPLVMRGWSRAPESRPAILIPLLVLAGGFMLRYAVLMAAPAFMAVRAR